jgi:hypothetical protein
MDEDLYQSCHSTLWYLSIRERIGGLWRLWSAWFAPGPLGEKALSGCAMTKSELGNLKIARVGCKI